MAKKFVPQHVDFQGEVDIQATAGGDGSPTFNILAYTGQPVRVANFGDPVLIDLAGVKFDKPKTPILADHDTGKRIGHTTSQDVVRAGGSMKDGEKTVHGPAIVVKAVASSSMGIAKGFLEDSKNGFPFQASIGARITDGVFVPAGEQVFVNGKTWDGPLVLAKKSTIREISVTVLGADNQTTVVAAKDNPSSFLELRNMDFEAYLADLGLDAATLTPEAKGKLEARFNAEKAREIELAALKNKPQGGNNPPQGEPDLTRQRDIRAAEEARVDGIVAACAQFPNVTKVKVGNAELPTAEFKAKAIKDGWTPEAVELAFRRSDYPTTGTTGTRGVHVANKDVNAQALEASLLAYAGVPVNATNAVTGRRFGLETWYKPEVLEASHAPQYRLGGSIQALMDLQIRAAGGYFPGSVRTGSDFVAAAVHAWEDVRASGFSTLNIVNVLENVANKMAMAGFEAVEGVWRTICGRRPLNDFKAHALYRLDFDGHFKKVAVDGELKHISASDTKKTITADTFGAMITVDRKTIKNDDLGLVLDKCRSLGTLGGMRIEEAVFATILGNAGTFWGAGNANYISGGSSALSVTSLSTARQKFRDQVINGRPINVSPRLLLVGTALETTANRLWTEDGLGFTGSTDATPFINNPFKGLYRPVVSGYLNNTSVTDQDGAALSGQSATQWFLFADPNAPQGASVVIGFVDGRETPYFDEAETAFNVPGGIQMRSYMDFGTALHIPQLSVKSAGA